MTRATAQSGTDPSHVPEIRDWIVRSLQPGEEIRSIMDRESIRRYMNHINSPTTAFVELHGMENAKLFWVPADQQHIIADAKQVLPPDLTISQDDIPYPSGFAVFQDGFGGFDAETGEDLPVKIRALRWSPINIYMDETMNEETAMHGVSLSSWCYSETRRGWIWVPLGRSDWAFGQRWNEYFGDPTEDVIKSVIEDRARFLALWSLMNTQEPLVYRPTRAEIRRDARLAPRTESRLVHVIRWDPHRYVSENPRPSDRKLTKRIPVEPFYRRQPFGPGRAFRRWTYIPAHFRGPVDAPLAEKHETVYKVVGDAEA